MNAVATPPKSNNRQRLDKAVAAWNAGDLDAYLTLYDDRLVLYGYGPAPMNKAEVSGFYRMIFATLAAEGGPAPRLEIFDGVEAGDSMALRFTQTGNHVGPFFGIPATGRPYVLSGITILRFADGRIVERWASADMLGLLIQLGAVQPPGAP